MSETIYDDEKEPTEPTVASEKPSVSEVDEKDITGLVEFEGSAVRLCSKYDPEDKLFVPYKFNSWEHDSDKEYMRFSLQASEFDYFCGVISPFPRGGDLLYVMFNGLALSFNCYRISEVYEFINTKNKDVMAKLELIQFSCGRPPAEINNNTA